ncbi:cuticle protein AM/CP1114-like [Penaeus japonicus]|uniref:cuticle protein AM/CP1114-like n=1 Tax=Penaeus japonicus TaxID=27405 RepID=UPI001C717A98|nr:cuticle protein AM/CP1114-like [Penaeus japonicus]
MKAVVLALLLAAAAADKAPSFSYDAPRERVASTSPVRQIAILRDDRAHPDSGAYSFDVETEDGIVRSESGSPDGSQQGRVSFTFPDGQEFDLEFVADENGYQPQSSFLPVAPAFPHPIPQFVLDQIAFAAEEDARKARGEDRQAAAAPRQTYGAPSK